MWSGTPAFNVVLGGETAVYQRHDGIRKMFREVDEALSSVHVEWFEIRDLGERIVAIGRLRICGRGSGAETESPVAVVIDLVDKKVRRVRTYLDPPQALEAAGLHE